MSVQPFPQAWSSTRARSWAVIGLATAVALASAHRYAGSWNDGTRLATVESLVDRHTLAIDDSIFVNVPAANAPGTRLPYPADDSNLLQHGTGDKLLIRGHFYSDKSPVPALLMAAIYQLLQWFTGLRAAVRPDQFSYAMTIASSGLAYGTAVWCVYRMAELVGLPARLQTLLTGSFALATVALPYARHVNNHVLLLGVSSALALSLAHLAYEASGSRTPWPRLLCVGALAGLGYTIDLGAGPPLVVCVVVLVTYRCRCLSATVATLAAALPWLILHHAVNYAVGGTLKPANAVPEYFNWPGCAFNAENMTGTWNHSVGHFFTYGLALLLGKRGFIGHNLPLFLALPAAWVLWRRRAAQLPEVVFAVVWSGGTWLAYALTSMNYSGQCCSIRWFVPLLGPGYYLLAVGLRECPSLRGSFLILSAWGACLAALMWWQGPWMKHMVPLYWPVQGVALLCCLSWTRVNLARPQPVTRTELGREQPGAEAA